MYIRYKYTDKSMYTFFIYKCLNSVKIMKLIEKF